ncbi:hypothetical protein [Fundicoccus culcitae]|uniref:Uncharacterized protein n=1 Tax=Fundicoccus culcitae TaxID=2969821 RepID=A0ABY5P458_9LACT|nr:hypothetical protein [Fundicoccus culcitae]UUX33477.1 hypothetical protein NRE15_11285 [Fundicoccus culcitae]
MKTSPNGSWFGGHYDSFYHCQHLPVVVFVGRPLIQLAGRPHHSKSGFLAFTPY